MTATATLTLLDVATAADLRTLVRRAGALDREGAVRLQAQGEVLAAWVGVLPGAGLTGEGTVLGLRTMRLDAPASLDVTVPVAALLDRFAREESTTLAVPPTQVRVPWAGVAPPRGGWEPCGQVSALELRRAVDHGVAEVAQGAGPSAPAQALAQLRARVWARPVEAADVEGLPSGMAFAARGLGFLGSAPGEVFRAGPWWRLTMPGGHVLAR